MKTQLQKRIESFVIRTGITAIVGVAAYLSNISEIQEITLDKIIAIVIAVVSANIVAELTKYGYNVRVESQEIEDLSNL